MSRSDRDTEKGMRGLRRRLRSASQTLSAQRGRSHNPRIIESRLQGYLV
jgi:hypothetical protein